MSAVADAARLFRGSTAAFGAWAVAAVGLTAVALAGAARVLSGPGVLPVDGHQWLLAVLGLLVGARVVSHVPRNVCGWALLAAGACSSVAVATSHSSDGVGEWLRAWAWWPGYGLLILALMLFPEGRVPSPRWRVAAGAILLGLGSSVLGAAALAVRVPGGLAGAGPQIAPGWDIWAVVVGGILLLIGLVAALAGLVTRLARASAHDRGPLAWGMAGALLLGVCLVLDAQNTPYTWLGVALAFPLATAAAVVRHGLYDIDLLVHRSLLNGALTAALICLYAAVVLLATDLVPLVAAPAAAAACAIAVLPARRRLHWSIDRWLYGQRSNPYELVAGLARGVGAALTPDELLNGVVTGVANGLRLPYVAICLDPDTAPQTECGRQRSWPLTRLPLVHRGERIGELIVQHRSPDEPWTLRERRLLADVARQIAPSAVSVRLTRDLQAARERLVRAREEEKRRLRHDLHDSLGPALSGARMQARACLSFGLDQNAARAVTALDQDLATALVEVRQVVDGLRPPALDRGLAEALTAALRRHTTADVELRFETAVPDLSGLPAAVEVAVYRVVDEALTNAVRHAAPTTVRLGVQRSPLWLQITVTDDGCGFRGPREAGVGLESMRERCEELGGTFAIENRPIGTEVTARFPIR